MKKNYQRTLIACYLGFITQAISANFAPLLFLTFHTTYHIPLGKIALISTAFFFTQLVVDLLCVKFVDQIGYRTCIVTSEITSAAGLIGLAILPDLTPDPFTGIILSVIIYAIGSGLIEVLCSPIIEACPFDRKEAVMSLLHSFYCWGSVAVILLSTIFFTVVGIGSWKLLACLWALVPLCNIYNFATCPIEHLVEDGKGLSVRSLFAMPVFWLAIVLMVSSGASELTMSQWASAFVESALGLSKTAGDLAGPCLFAITMGISRAIFGKWGDRLDLRRYMIGSGILCLICYLLASMTALPILGLIGCVVCGFSVGIMWPGTLSLSSRQMPLGGTAMFALLAMAGDLGGSLGPSVVGYVAQQAGDDLQIGLQVGCIFPVILVLGLLLLRRTSRQKQPY